MNNYTHHHTTVSFIRYHFVFCPRYRRKIFKNTQIEKRFKEITQSICEENGFTLVTMECHQDHAHLFIGALPSYSPADIMAKIKGGTSKYLREEFSELAHLNSLWTRSYFVSTAGNVSQETIQAYINNQKKSG